MTTYILIEGHGEAEAVSNLLTRLAQECAPTLLPFGRPIRVPGIASDKALIKHIELVRGRPDARAIVALRDDEDGCPKDDGPALGERLRDLHLPFPAAAVLAYREYETLFLPCIEAMAGRPFAGPGGSRSGLRAGARYEGDFEAKRGVKEWLTSQMPPGRTYKPTVDQLPLTRMSTLLSCATGGSHGSVIWSGRSSFSPRISARLAAPILRRAFRRNEALVSP